LKHLILKTAAAEFVEKTSFRCFKNHFTSLLIICSYRPQYPIQPSHTVNIIQSNQLKQQTLSNPTISHSEHYPIQPSHTVNIIQSERLKQSTLSIQNISHCFSNRCNSLWTCTSACAIIHVSECVSLNMWASMRR